MKIAMPSFFPVLNFTKYMLIYCFMILGVVSGCSDETSIGNTSISSGEWGELTHVNGVIEAPQQRFYRLSKYYPEVGLMAYNERSHAFDIYEINDKVECRYSVELENEGPMKVETVRDFHFLASDSILCVGRNSIKTVSLKGGVSTVIVLNNTASPLQGIDLNRYQVSVKGEAGILSGFIDGHFYVPLHDFHFSDFNEPEKYSKGSLLCGELDLVTGNISSTAISYPDFMTDALYGFGSEPKFVYTKDAIIYYFSGFPEIYIFNPEDGKTNVLDAEIPGVPQTPSIGSMDASVHVQLVVQYTNGVYDQLNNCFYQDVLFPAPKIKGEKRKLITRKVDLKSGEQIFVETPPYYSFMGMFVKDGLLYKPNMIGGENKISFVAGELLY